MSTKERVDTLLSGGTVITVDGQRRVYRDGYNGGIINACVDVVGLGCRIDWNEVMDRCAVLGEQVLARSGLTVPGKWLVL